MPLAMQMLSATPDIWGVSFQMLSPTGTTVHCRITRTAIEKLADRQDDLSGFEQAIPFDHWRNEIERLASEKYDTSTFEKGPIVIGPEDIVRAVDVRSGAATLRAAKAERSSRATRSRLPASIG
jgi:hypothetical protein